MSEPKIQKDSNSTKKIGKISPVKKEKEIKDSPKV